MLKINKIGPISLYMRKFNRLPSTPGVVVGFETLVLGSKGSFPGLCIFFLYFSIFSVFREKKSERGQSGIKTKYFLNQNCNMRLLKM